MSTYCQTYFTFLVLVFNLLNYQVQSEGPPGGNKNLCFSIEENSAVNQPAHIHRILAPTFKQCADACVNYPRGTCTFVVYQRVSGSCRLFDADSQVAKRNLKPSQKHVFGAITTCGTEGGAGPEQLRTDQVGVEINRREPAGPNRGRGAEAGNQLGRARGGRGGSRGRQGGPRPRVSNVQVVKEVWADWTDWTPCSATCGDDGEQSRYRRCLSFSCSGKAEERQRCRARIPCAQWSDWTSWSGCSVTCEHGIRTRNRFCPNYFGCDGARQEQEMCAMPPCINWSEWSAWSACSKLCGGGSTGRTRRCSGYGCPGEPSETKSCNDQSCCAEWAAWSACSVSCGLPSDGVETRARRCIVDSPASRGGYGSKTEEDRRQCSAYVLQPCPTWSTWAEWMQCSQSCGGGERHRKRTCSRDGLCPGGSDEEIGRCNDQPCPQWSDWGTWSQCGVTCGGGTSRRLRVCTMGTTCPGEAFEESVCNPAPCPEWTQWAPWADCSDSCGGGVQRRARNCDQYGLCIGDANDKRQCNTHTCPVADQWTKFSECTESCGGGIKNRQRNCRVDPNWCKGDLLHNDPSCNCGEAKMNEAVSCNAHECAAWQTWQEWNECSASCGGGRSIRRRKCRSDSTFCAGYNQNHPSCQCSNEPPQELRPCNDHACPTWGSWAPWAVCTVTCGGGSQQRERRCMRDEVYCSRAGADEQSCACAGLDHQNQECSTFLCPEYSPWEHWGRCTLGCGGGIRSRGRTCLTDAMRCSTEQMIGDPTCTCQQDPAQSEPCNQHFCPYYASWQDWSPCSVSCAGGERYRTRKCVLDTEYCIGEVAATDPACQCPITQLKQEIDTCNTHKCAEWTSWEPWSQCTNLCNGGTKSRTRICDRDEAYCADYSGLSCQCVGLSEDTAECNRHYCAVWSTWEGWQQCSVSCGGGQKVRNRPCNPDPSFCAVNGDDPSCRCNAGSGTDIDGCNGWMCPHYSDWQPWQPCSVSCGGGQKVRNRPCNIDVELCGRYPDDPSCRCQGTSADVDQCNAYTCPHWADWSPWGHCSVTCSTGQQIRRRPCNVDSNYCTLELMSTHSCQCAAGGDLDSKPCDKGECFQWSDWQPWSDCNVVCGGGSRTRARTCAQEGGCPGSPLETGICNNVPCPDWGSWSAWSDCSVSCNTGQRARTRSCPIRGGCSPGVGYESDICGTDQCPQWTSWGDWSPCDRQCGHGERTRSRNCDPIPDACLGRGADVEQCFVTACMLNTHWSQWSPCTLTCGGGLKTRSRAECPNAGCAIEDDTAACNEQDCPQWTTWNSWSQCSRTCGGGSRRRKRTCADNGTQIFNGCLGQPLQYDPVPCNYFACIVTKKR